MLSEQSTSKTKGDFACEAMEAVTHERERQEETRRLYEQKCHETAEAETFFSGAIKDTLENTESLEKHVKTVTMRAESLATAGADFFKTLLDRQAAKHRHPLHTLHVAQRRKKEGRRDEHARLPERTRSTRRSFSQHVR